MRDGTAEAPEKTGAASGGSGRPSPGSLALPAALFAAFAAACLLLYAGALRGPFVSDDFGYFQGNPYTDELSPANVAAIVNPFGPAKHHTANYAPVHLLLHALEWQIFAENPLGYHVTNVGVHALCSTLLVLLLLQAGLPRTPALVGGALLAFHPANVEAVAWISQLKTTGSMAFALGALLAFSRRPGLSALLFTLGLLTKASAAFALPMAAALAWCRAGTPAGDARHWRWLGVWLVLFGLYAIPQSQAFAHAGGVSVEAYADPWVHARTIAAVGARYLVMAATTLGVSAFQEPEPVRAWSDPWWLLALVLGAALAGRAVACLGRRAVEGAFWVGAAAAFVPVSQLFPFLVPVADRYLYAILPGLLGGALFASQDLREGLRGRVPAAALARAGLGIALALAVGFAARSALRAPLWRSETRLLQDAARHYPDGATAHLLRARRAAQRGDARAAAAALRASARRGFDHFMGIRADPGFALVRDEPVFRDVLREMAGDYLARARERGDPTQPELYRRAQAHELRGELREAEAALARAQALGGPLDAAVREKLARLRAREGAS